MEQKKNVIILGGCGFIGRNLVAYLVSNKLVNRLRVVDKVPPQVAWLHPEHQKYFDDPIVEFKHANLVVLESCKNAFLVDDEISGWDYAINCAGETKYGQSSLIYKEGVYKLSSHCIEVATLCKVKHYIDISSGQVFSSDKPGDEEHDCAPWTYVAKWKHEAESIIRKSRTKCTILRPALVYGRGDRQGLTSRAMVAAIYKFLNEPMKFLWDSDIRVNTVHVDDLCRAIWYVCGREEAVGQIYNVVDQAGSTQGSLASMLSEIFKVKVSYYGNLVSSVVDLGNAADEANDKHLVAWANACQQDDIQNTPLSPYMDFELLQNKHLNLDGTKLRNLGFTYTVPKPTVESIREALKYFLDMKVFPPSLVP
ncbi:PREDICTED: uncharacterized protein LOC108557368 [Nicrophorus vespilloides]|uniref:Uncharacterized protein LOC108557368 n=1 Tax=Nicrophorus vespilloides TaxID=110193 RepID=A0ABM1M444_NICVS|nr:PREDICTED: uncharacterized protein LOC108557368 [Nicrophorus vespilloides]